MMFSDGHVLLGWWWCRIPVTRWICRGTCGCWVWVHGIVRLYWVGARAWLWGDLRVWMWGEGRVWLWGDGRIWLSGARPVLLWGITLHGRWVRSGCTSASPTEMDNHHNGYDCQHRNEEKTYYSRPWEAMITTSVLQVATLGTLPAGIVVLPITCKHISTARLVHNDIGTPFTNIV